MLALSDRVATGDAFRAYRAAYAATQERAGAHASIAEVQKAITDAEGGVDVWAAAVCLFLDRYTQKILMSSPSSSWGRGAIPNTWSMSRTAAREIWAKGSCFRRVHTGSPHWSSGIRISRYTIWIRTTGLWSKRP